MKLVKMTNNTSKTLAVQPTPFSANNAPIEVPSNDSAILGVYSRAYSDCYAAMVKQGFSMSIIDEDSTVKSSIGDPSKEPVVSSNDVTDTMPANTDNGESSTVETEVVEEQDSVQVESTEENLTEESPSKRRRSRRSNTSEDGDENA